MFSPFERMVAWRYLRARREEGFISVIAAFSFLGIMLGVATLIIVMSVMNGFRDELVGRILGLNGHLTVYSYERPFTDYDAFANEIRKIDGVKMVTPVIEHQALITVRGKSRGAVIRGFVPEDLMKKPIISTSAVQGVMRDFGGTNVAIGKELAKALYLSVGDEIVLVSPEAKRSPFGSIPRSRKFKIGVIFDVGMYEYNSGFVFVPLDAAQKFFRLGDSVSSLEIFSDEIGKIDEVKERLKSNFEGRARVFDWSDSNASLVNALEVERNVMFLILTLIILVAAFNIISSLIMLVKEKGRAVAIMRTMGASRATIMKIFFITGSLIGVVGTLFGAVLGISFAANIETIRQWIESLIDRNLFSAEIYFLSKMPASINWNEVIVVIGMALVISFLATIYPAWKAARLNPVEALRYE